MAVRMSPHLMSDDNNDTLNNLMTFCIQLLHHSQWKSKTQFICGSRMEIPLRQLIHEHYNITDDMTDYDLIVYLIFSSPANRSF